MTSFKVEFKAPGVIKRLRAGVRMSVILEEVASEVEAQTRIRLTEEKRDPQGKPWEKWSDSYAKTRGPGKSLGQDSGAFLDSIQSFTTKTEAIVGPNIAQALWFDQGTKTPQPARQVFGLSFKNELDIEQLMVDLLDKMITG